MAECTLHIPSFLSSLPQHGLFQGDHAKTQTPLIILANYKRRQDIVSIIGTCSLRPNYRDVHIFALFVCPNSCSIPQDFDLTVPLTNSPPHCEVQSHSEGRKPDFP